MSAIVDDNPAVLAQPARALVKTGGRLLGGSLHPAARRIESGIPGADLSALDGRLFCLLLTRRRDGRWVPTPLAFARRGDRVLVRTDAHSVKVARARRRPDALVAPCGPRGKPLGPALAVRARVLTDPGEREAAERALTAAYGLRGRFWTALLRTAKLDVAYIELSSQPRTRS
jgi:PPOX class probable F420-dependent enzyme